MSFTPRPAALFLLLALLSAPASRAAPVDVDADSAVRFLLAHEKPNGAFGPRDQSHTDLAWNYPAARALVLLGVPVPRPADCFANGRGAAYLEEKSHNKLWAWDIHQRAHLAAALRLPPGPEYDLKASWTLEPFDRAGKYYAKLDPRKLAARVAPFYDVASLYHFVSAITAAGGTVSNPGAAAAFLLPRQCPNGAFEDAYRADAPRDDAAAHLVPTAEAVLTLRALNLPVPRADACAAWIRSCQASDGGFRYSATAEAYSNRPDVWYTACAAEALEALGAKPADRSRAVAWINSLQNADGGFGDRPGWTSRLYSTFYAVHALHLLTGDASRAVARKTVSPPDDAIPDGKWSIFQAHLKSPPGGAEMVDAARAMKFNFLGVKTNAPGAPPAPVPDARRHAKEKNYPLDLVENPENYPHKLLWPGGHRADHVSNWLIPPDMTPAQRRRWDAAETVARTGLPWSRFKAEVIAPALEVGTLFYPELDHGMVNAYMVYDDGLAGRPDDRPGYNAIVGALGYEPWDWIRFFPYRERWVGRLPVLADGDAHGDLAAWSERLDRQRVLYLATDPTLQGFLDACQHHRTVCVIRRGPDRSELILYGAPNVVAYARKHLPQWKWWDSPAE